MIRVCRRYGAVSSLVVTRNTAVQRAIDAIPQDAWTPVQYPGAVRDPETGAWISDAEVAEAAGPVTPTINQNQDQQPNQPPPGLSVVSG